MEREKIFEKLNFEKGGGLIPVVVQDVKTKEVLMLGYMNKEALEKTLTTGFMHYYSRSRGRLWMKGEESGHYQVVREAFYDCDGDTLLFKVEQIEACCHEGYYTCFH
ncbi:MAG: phosphoribosyl-AMP cyclohydrolase, partial [Candidatus Jordarchaeales archaeon]